MATVTAGQVADAVKHGQVIADLILEAIEGADPGVALEAAAAEKVVNLTAAFAATALNAYNKANGVEITADTIEALKANPAPLTPPDAAAQAGTGDPAAANAAATQAGQAEDKPVDHGTDG